MLSDERERKEEEEKREKEEEKEKEASLVGLLSVKRKIGRCCRKSNDVGTISWSQAVKGF